jgi:phosphonate transport system substrate-binding protein
MGDVQGLSWRRLLLVLCCAGQAIAAALPGRAADALTFYVVPQFPVDEIHRTWSPVLKKVGEQAGITLHLKIPASITAFEKELLAGVPDVAYMNPYHAVMARRAARYEPILSDGEQMLSGILVVPIDSEVRTVQQLAGREIAFPSPNAFGASLYLRALLTQNEKITFRPRYVSTHSNAYRLTIAGAVAAGGGIRQTLGREPAELRSRLRVIYETPQSSPHPVGVHPRVTPAQRKALQAAMIGVAESPETAQLMAEIQLRRPRAASYADYAPLERLSLEKFVSVAAD